MPLIRINSRPGPRQLLLFAGGWLCCAGGLAVHQWAKGHQTVAAIAGLLALLVPAVGALWREGLRLLYVGLCHATYPLGYVVSSVVLLVLFYGVFTPLGLLLRLWRHDPLGRRAAPAPASYWRERERGRTPASYFKQY